MTEPKRKQDLSLTKSSEQLNKQILEYYYNFGQNRDLEKYLRLNPKNNKSSSEGSLSGISKYSSDIGSKNTKRQSKSLDYFENSVSPEDVAEKVQYNKELIDNHPSENDFFILKNTGKDESCQRLSATSLHLGNQSVNISEHPIISKTCDNPKSVEKEISVLRSDKLVKTSIDDQRKFNKKENKTQETGNLHQKTEKILEWDSLGDVGYNRSSETSNIHRSMSTIERSVLRGFFADRGIEISFPANKVNKEEKGNGSERWRVTLENVKKKYASSPNLLKRNSVEIPKKQPDKQISGDSTFLGNLSKTFQFQNQDSITQSTPKADINISPVLSKEQYCQTSIICKEDQLVQCNFSTASNSVIEDPSVASQSSFIYVAQEFENTASNSGQTSSSKESNTVKTFVDRKLKLRDSMHKFIESKTSKVLDMERSKDIDLGISLLCSLIESKNFNNHQKKKLAHKIVTKISKQHFTSTDESEKDSSKDPGVSSIENLTSTSSASIKITSRKTSVDVSTQVTEETKKYSNVDRKRTPCNNKHENSSQESFMKNEKIPTQKEKLNFNVEKNLSDTSSIKMQNSQLFETMKEWLEPLTNSELAYDRRIKNESKESVNSHKNSKSCKSLESSQKNSIVATKDIQKRIHLNWIENEIKRLENLKNLLTIENNANVDKCSTKLPQKIYKTKSNLQREYDSTIKSAALNEKSVCQKKESELHIYDDTHSGSKRKESKLKQSLHSIPNFISESQMMRSKLKTPSKEINDHDSSDSIRTFVKNKKREFIENYKIAHSSRKSYDHPMMSDHYSEPGYKNIPIANNDFIFSSKYRNTASATTSNDFISSESISIPVVNSDNSSMSTSHQYDATAINGIGIQTSDSILQTTPIFGISPEDKLAKANSHNLAKKTTRVYGPRGKSQQIQVKPQTISYTIKVDDNKYTEIKDNENVSLQEYLQRQCPQFYIRASKRQAILKEMQKLRKEREEQIRHIAENTSISSINRKLNHIPPPPTKCIRVFSTKEMKALTKKKQQCLSEVVDKFEKKKKEKQRRGTKILTEVFNKRLQKQVHKGKLSLDHSITVI